CRVPGELGALLVCSQGRYAETLWRGAAPLLCRVPMTAPIPRLVLALGPTTPSQHRPLGVTGHLHLLYFDAGAWLAPRPQGIEAAGLARPWRHGAQGGAAGGRPAPLLQGGRPRRPRAPAPTPDDPPGPPREPPAAP